jgi:hypothetical protein
MEPFRFLTFLFFERILGDSDFVGQVLQAANENLDRKYQLKSQGYDVNVVGNGGYVRIIQKSWQMLLEESNSSMGLRRFG